MRLRRPDGRLAPLGDRAALTMDQELAASRPGRPYHIYALVDRRDNEIRYIGKSIRPHQRLQSHWGEQPTNCHRSHWIQQLRGGNHLRPRLLVLQSLATEPDWKIAESWWIATLRDVGFRLVNNTSGGDGVSGLPEETRRRMAAVWIGRKHKPESLVKMANASRGRKSRPESNEKRIKTLKAVVHHEEWNSRVAEAVRKLDADRYELVCAELGEGALAIDVARRHKLHRTTVSKVKLGTYHERYRK